jgi:hypothetical protein
MSIGNSGSLRANEGSGPQPRRTSEEIRVVPVLPFLALTGSFFRGQTASAIKPKITTFAEKYFHELPFVFSILFQALGLTA